MEYKTQHKITKMLLDEFFSSDDSFLIREIACQIIHNMSREDIVKLFNITKDDPSHDNKDLFDTRWLEITYQGSIDVDDLLSRGWVKYDWNQKETRPKKYGKYFVMRKDGKIHWETWNGNGFAYNNNSIIYWREIKKPIIRNYNESK
jgi:hypothetical protein